MTTSPTLAPPWNDPVGVAVVTERAAHVMRLGDADPDVIERLPLAAQAACDLIDDYLDRGTRGFTTATVPEAVMGAAVAATIELYRRKDAPFGVAAGWSQVDVSEYAQNRLGTDWIKGVETQLWPYRLTFGIG